MVPREGVTPYALNDYTVPQRLPLDFLTALPFFWAWHPFRPESWQRLLGTALPDGFEHSSLLREGLDVRNHLVRDTQFQWLSTASWPYVETAESAGVV